MKVKAKYVALLLPIMMLLWGGCTRNNGDIGKWFGKWQLQQLTIDGQPSESVASGRFFWDFQNDIIRIDCVKSYEHQVNYCIGTWSQSSDNAMTLNFSHTDDHNIFHAPFRDMHFPADAPFTLTIISQSGKECVMKRVDESTSTEYCYYLRKR